MKSKSLLISLFLLILAFSLAACSGGSENTSSDSNGGKDSGDSEKVEIRFSWWGDTGRNEVYNAIIDKFEEKHPNITVKREFGGWGDYWDKLSTQIAGGNAPDVVSMHQSYVSDYARRGALLQLDDIVNNGEIDLKDFPESAIDAGKVDDKIVMIAKGVTMPGWAYNTALFDELGVEYPEMDWTWDDYAAKLAELDAAIGSDDQFASPDNGGGQLEPSFRHYLRQLGKDTFTEEGKLDFEKEDLVSWWTMWDDFRKKGYIPDAETGAEYANVPLEQSMFVTGKVALTQIPANQLTMYQEQFDSGELRMVRMPVMPDGEDSEYIGAAFLSITEKSKHPKEAAMFIEYFVNAEEAWELFKVNQGPPASTDGSEFVKQFLEPADQRAVEFIQETLPYAHPAPVPPQGVGEIEQAFADNYDAIAFGEVTVEEAADAFMETAKSIVE